MHDLKDRYIDLLKHVLTDYHRMEYDEYKPLYWNDSSWRRQILIGANRFLEWLTPRLGHNTYVLCERVATNQHDRQYGLDWPAYADTMIGIKRLENIEYCINAILKDNIPGDLIETGVWRGGASIFMKALLEINNVHDRIVWLADSFQGLPPPDAKYAADAGDRHHANEQLAVSLEAVKRNFEKYGLLDDQIRILKGWFKDTLPRAPIKQLSLIRLDGDMYGSTMDALVPLYSKLAPGGFLIIDDWVLKGCRRAILDYRERHGITEEIVDIDGMGAFWRKEARHGTPSIPPVTTSAW